MVPRITKRIGRRIAVIVGLAMAAGGLGGLLLVVEQSRLAHAATTGRFLHAVARVVSGSFSVIDPQRNRHKVEDILAQLGQEEDIASVDIFDQDGVIRWSTAPGHQGQRADDDLVRAMTSKLAQGPRRGAASTVVVPLRLTTECRNCHEGGPDPLGAVALRAGPAEHLGGFASIWRQGGVWIILYVGGLTLLLLALIHRLVVARVLRLVQVMSNAEEGDFLARAPVDAPDEIGALATAFNKMLAKITDLRAERIDTQREMSAVKDELDLKRQLAEKSELLQWANERLNARIRQLSFLNQLSHDLASRLDLDYLMELFSQRVTDALQVPQFAALLLDEDRGELRVVKARGFGSDDDAIVTPFPLGDGLSSEAVRARHAIYVPDVRADDRKIAYRSGAGVRGTLLVVPIVYQDRVLGLLNFSSPAIHAFEEEERELFLTIAHQAALALGNARLFEETVELTLADGLTGLLNRRALEARLEHEWARAERSRTPLSVVMIDIDHFKDYNDQNGHLLGDETLRRVARILASSTRRTDACARYGGEEFLVILPATGKAEALDVAAKLRRSVEQADFVQGYRQPLGRVTVSGGVATAPEDAQSLAKLLHAADQAMLSAKRAGRNRIEEAKSAPTPQPNLAG